MTTTSNHYVTVLWEARAKSGKEAAMKAFMTAAVTASRYDAGNIDYEAHQVERQPGAFVIFGRWERREALESHLRRGSVKPGADERLREVVEGGGDRRAGQVIADVGIRNGDQWTPSRALGSQFAGF